MDYGPLDRNRGLYLALGGRPFPSIEIHEDAQTGKTALNPGFSV